MIADHPCEVPLALASPARQGEHWAVFELLPKTTFSFAALLPGGRLSYELGLPVPLVRWPECMLVVRMHGGTLAGTGARATLVCELATRCQDEPATAFVWPLPLASAVVDANTAAGSALMTRLRSDVGTLARSWIHLDQASVPTTATVTLSASLLARAPADAHPEDRACPCTREGEAAAPPAGGWR
ncbi:MAG: hypothetical protein K1X88_01695 [Nannocystaceae bacterium]|nr:hypothetical protein [Nannocystaceae bacterium]